MQAKASSICEHGRFAVVLDAAIQTVFVAIRKVEKKRVARIGLGIAMFAGEGEEYRGGEGETRRKVYVEMNKGQECE